MLLHLEFLEVLHQEQLIRGFYPSLSPYCGSSFNFSLIEEQEFDYFNRVGPPGKEGPRPQECYKSSLFLYILSCFNDSIN